MVNSKTWPPKDNTNNILYLIRLPITSNPKIIEGNLILYAYSAMYIWSIYGTHYITYYNVTSNKDPWQTVSHERKQPQHLMKLTSMCLFS